MDKEAVTQTQAEPRSPTVKVEDGYISENGSTPRRKVPDEAHTPPLEKAIADSNWESGCEDSAETTPSNVQSKKQTKRASGPTPLRDEPMDINRNTNDLNQTDEDEPNDEFFHDLLAPACEPEPVSKIEATDDVPLDYLDGLIDNVEPLILAKTENLHDMDVCSENAVANVLELAAPVHIDNTEHQASDLPSDENLEARIEQRLKELKKLKEKTVNKNRKNHKKDKRRSSPSVATGNGHKKRHRSRSRSHERRQKERKRRREHSAATEDRHNIRNKVANHPIGLPKVPRVKSEQTNDHPPDSLPLRQSEKSIKVVKLSNLLQTPDVQPHVPLTAKGKRKMARERVKTLLNLLRMKSSKAPSRDSEFLVVDTIHKLPSSTSFMSQGIFENPSPICNNFNVKYQFNSSASSCLSLAKWGLEAMPATTTELLRLTGINVTRLRQLQQSTKMSQRMLKLKEEAAAKASSIKAEDFGTSLYANASTQTDSRMGARVHDVGVQATLVSQPSNGAFWNDSKFDETQLSQNQANVMFSLQELCQTMPSPEIAGKLYGLICPALKLHRAMSKN